MGRRPRDESPFAAAAEELSRRVREHRVQHGWSQQRLAQEAGVSIGTIRAIEGKRVMDPGVFTVRAIAGALSYPLAELAADPAPAEP